MRGSRYLEKKELENRIQIVDGREPLKKSGIPIGSDHFRLEIDDSSISSLIIGASGSGKTQSILLPSLRTTLLAGDSAIVVDPMGEIYEETFSDFQQAGYDIFRISFQDYLGENCFNPFHYPYEEYKKGNIDHAISMVHLLGYYLLSDKMKNHEDSFWENSMIDYFIGLTLYLFENSQSEEIHFFDIFQLEHDLEHEKTCSDFLEKLSKKSLSFLYLESILKAPPETKGSILSVFRQKYHYYLSRKEFLEASKETNFSYDSFFEKKAILYISFDVMDTNLSSRMIPLMIHQFIYQVPKKKREHFINIYYDCFDMHYAMDDLSSLISYTRSLNVRFFFFIQSYSHLLMQYTNEEINLMKLSIGMIVYLLSDDIPTLKDLSEWAGNTYDKYGNAIPLITPEELRAFQTFEALYFIPRYYPYRVHLEPYYLLEFSR